MKLSTIRAVALILLTAVAISATGAAAAKAPSSVSVLLTSHGPRIVGQTHWRPGTVRIIASSQRADQEVTLLHFRAAYTYADFLTDAKKTEGRGPAARAAVNRVFSHVIFDGGIDLFAGQTASFTATVTPGTYYLGEMNNPPQLTTIHVHGAPSTIPTHSAGTISATDDRYRITGHLAARGTLTFANASDRPQRLNLIPVDPGTTRAQVLAYIRKAGVGVNAPPPPFAVNGPQLGSAELSPRQRMLLTYRLRAGTYVVLNVGTDMKTGHPEALEGLVGVITLG